MARASSSWVPIDPRLSSVDFAAYRIAAGRGALRSGCIEAHSSLSAWGRWRAAQAFSVREGNPKLFPHARTSGQMPRGQGVPMPASWFLGATLGKVQPVSLCSALWLALVPVLATQAGRLAHADPYSALQQ